MKQNILQMEDVTPEVAEAEMDSNGPSLEGRFNVNLKRIKFNIWSAVSKIFTDTDQEFGTGSHFKLLDQFKAFLQDPGNSTIFTHAFWFVLVQVSPMFQGPQPTRLTELLGQWKSGLLSRIANAHSQLMLDVSPALKKVLDKLYFDVVCQAVFYSFFYAFPKSRPKFNKEFKCEIFRIISFTFKGCEVSHKSRFLKNWNFIDDWYLNLGAGNLLVDHSGDLTRRARRLQAPRKDLAASQRPSEAD